MSVSDGTNNCSGTLPATSCALASTTAGAKSLVATYNGDANFTLSQVALNDTIMVFAFAPIVGLLLGLSSIAVPWTTLFLSVVLYIVVPVIRADSQQVLACLCVEG